MAPKENAEDIVNNNSSVPSWIKQEYFENIISDEIGKFSRITKFKPESGSAPGDNYASVMVRILIEVELEDGSVKEFPLMMKTTHSESSVAGNMVNEMGVFDRESEMYEKIIPAFEKLYSDNGKKVVFGPKSFKLSKNPGVETIVLEDLRPRKFKNANRVEGLDFDHTKSVLKILAEFHAASAVYYETVGPFADKFKIGMFDPAKKDIMAEIYKPMLDVIKESFKNNIVNAEYYNAKLFGEMDEILEKLYEAGRIKPEEFNVLNHGDSWCNNIMFNYNDDGERNEIILVDFQMCKYGSPAQDLFYFIFSSVKQEIRLEKFDVLIKYYYDNLVENLRLLNYPKELPTLVDLNINLLRNHEWAKNTTFGILAVCLLEHTENANIDNFISSDEDGLSFKNNLYGNPKYIKCVNEILPWLDNRGMLE